MINVPNIVSNGLLLALTTLTYRMVVNKTFSDTFYNGLLCGSLLVTGISALVIVVEFACYSDAKVSQKGTAAARRGSFRRVLSYFMSVMSAVGHNGERRGRRSDAAADTIIICLYDTLRQRCN